MNKEKILLLIIRFFLGAVFIYAAIGKIIQPQFFAEQINNYQMLPYILVTILAVTLPWIEFICGVLLIWGKWLKGASFIVLLLNFVFIIAIASAMVRGLDIECGCFSLSQDASKVGWLRIFEDVLFLAGTGYIFLTADKKKQQGT